jgi:hypothetical protein
MEPLASSRDQDANRGRRDIRVYSWICAVGAAVAVVAAILMWGDGGQNDVSIVFLVLAVLLLPPFLLLRRDALRRDKLIGGTEIRQLARTVAPLERREDVDQVGQIVVTRPAGFYQDAVRRYRILIDGQAAGRLKRGESLRHTVQAGRHEVVAKIDWSGSPAAQVDVPPGGTVTLKVGPGSPVGGFFSSDKWLTLSVDG